MFPFCYTQTGINFFVKKEASMDLSYGTHKHENPLDALFYTLTRNNPFKLKGVVAAFLDYHSPKSYYKHMFVDENNSILFKDIDDLYRELN